VGARFIKVNPADIDLVLRVEGVFYNLATAEQRSAMDWVGQNLYGSHRCDSYLLLKWPDGHPNFWLGEYWYAYWLRQWGFSRGSILKGIAVLQLTGG
jgi:hypothetical protein